MKEQIASHVGAVEEGKWGGRGVKWGALEWVLEVRDPKGQAVGEHEGGGAWLAGRREEARPYALLPFPRVKRSMAS